MKRQKDSWRKESKTNLIATNVQELRNTAVAWRNANNLQKKAPNSHR